MKLNELQNDINEKEIKRIAKPKHFEKTIE